MSKKISLMVKSVSDSDKYYCVIAEHITKRSIIFNRPNFGFNQNGQIISYSYQPDILFISQIQEDRNEPGLFWEI